MSVIQKLYDSEINASISTFWDGGFAAKLGDEMNGFASQSTLGTYAEAEQFLDSEARRLFPQSLYACGAEPSGYNPALVGVGVGGASLNGVE